MEQEIFWVQDLTLPPTLVTFRRWRLASSFSLACPGLDPYEAAELSKASLALEPSRECGQVGSSPRKLKGLPLLLQQELLLDHMHWPHSWSWTFKECDWEAEATCCQEERLHFSQPKSTSSQGAQKRCNLRGSPKCFWAAAPLESNGM